MYIIETCPKCGDDLEFLTLTMNPPIPARRCRRCGWYWQGKAEIPIRVPFQIDDFVVVEAEEVYDKYTDTAGNLHWIGTRSGEHTIKLGVKE